MIQIQDLYKRFGKVQVLKGVNLDIGRGGIFAILGPNGSGKTTLIKSILGMVVADKGDIKIADKSVLRKFEYRKNIDYLPQIANFPANLTVSELIGMIRNLRAKTSSHEQLIDLFDLTPFLNQKLGNLSGGTRQKVNLVLTFMFDSELIILDEPTTGLDPVSLIRLKQRIEEEKKKGKTILISSHIMSFVEEIADEIVFLLDGKIHFKGTVSDLMKQTGQQNLEYAIANILTDNHA
ncbi:ATP-binding cassette domain-containing protein [Leptobacterium flavescens]|uniref:ATP-binding cassette domain-containing protein n=1 Tax=Leptobacterium flavescens TaxID=472055 RepID=A0A6P0UW98_9FLAO|nr:ABC transporter ATP-binding protein [Leptobacterium flavescens]NER14706.1 ATP-binding cassette domain-containing protein [Leptobacterium flavescens]